MTGASVVIPCYSEERWDRLVGAVESALAQVPAPARVVVVVDHNERLLDRARRELSGVTVVANDSERGASGARNTGVAHTDTPLIALLDDDTRARPGWLAELLAPFDDPSVIGTGGAIVPSWERGRPVWFPEEFLWVVGASYRGMPTTTAPIRNVWSESMAVRRAAFLAVGGFRVGFGKLGERARPEDTDLCLRMSEATGGHWVYAPASLIDHAVPARRSTFGFFLARTWSEGRGKIELARMNRGRQSLGSEQSYVRELPASIARSTLDTLRGKGFGHLARAGALSAGLASAATGGGVEWLFGRRATGPTEPHTTAAPVAALPTETPMAPHTTAAPIAPLPTETPMAPHNIETPIAAHTIAKPLPTETLIAPLPAGIPAQRRSTETPERAPLVAKRVE